MDHLTIPKGYESALNLHETQVAIKVVKDFFQNLLAERLNLLRVSAPLFVDPTSGLNDNLNGVERPVSFDILEQQGREAEVVQSLAKWKRFALKKYGFSVIVNMVEERKAYIDESLEKAREANEKLSGIRQESERLLQEAREKQAEIIKEAKATGDGIVREARNKAEQEGAKLLEEAKRQIDAEKENALRDIRQTVAELSVQIAEKELHEKLSDDKNQQQLIEKLLADVAKAE